MGDIKFKKNVKTNLIVTLIGIIVVFCITMFLMYSYTKSTTDRVKQYAEFSVAQNSQRIADEINSTIEYAMCSIREVSDVISRNLETHENENPKEIIGIMLQNTPFRAIEYINADGINMTDAGEMFDASDREYFIEGIQGNTGIWINYTPKYTDEALLNFYTPIYANKDIVGVITGYLCGDSDILPILKSSFFGKEIRGILCDENGVVITTTFGYKYGTMLEELAGTVGKTVSDRDEYINELQSEKTRLSYYNDKYGQALAYTCRVTDTDWYVIQIVPGSSLMDIVGQLSTQAYIVVTCMIVLFAVIIVQIIIDNKKKHAMEQSYIDNVEKINDSLEKERYAISKIHETISSGSWRIEFNENNKIEECIWSDGFRRLLGFRNENEFPNNIKSLHNLVDDEINKTISEMFWKAAMDNTEQTVFDVEYQINTRTDGIKWFRAAGRFSRRENGTPKTFYGMIIDIDERKKNEEKLRIEQMRLVTSLKEQLRLEDDAEKEKSDKAAYDILCKSYIKILKANLTTNTYSVIQMNKDEKDESHGYNDALSEWLISFAQTDNVHEEDKADYIQKTDITYLRNFFRIGKQHFYIHYRRKCEDIYQSVLMEIVSAPTYSDDNQEVYLYVKNID